MFRPIHVAISDSLKTYKEILFLGRCLPFTNNSYHIYFNIIIIIIIIIPNSVKITVKIF
jgi:hypothetical protein